MASPASAKKQIIESIKDKTNVLVTVSNNPSVDELAAALGLTIFLNKLGKHATAVVSGEIPSVIDFLDPDKTFEATTDSLRDFIIALDKEKADHLRFKPEGDVVKIFITPYRTKISSDDLQFSQGDYNVELVLALNVANRDELDTALAAHGKILHDATVATITSGEIKSNLGSIDWRDTRVSGVSEMISEVVQELKNAKSPLDEQIATALMTGIVASTERFSNDLTSSRVMTIAAELMAAGANQQLIASKLQEGEEEPVQETPPQQDGQGGDGSGPSDGAGTGGQPDDSNLRIDRSNSEPSQTEPQQPEPTPEPQPEVAPDGSIGVMKINHSREGDIDDVARQVMQESQEDAARAAEAQLDRLVDAAPVVAPQDEPELAPAPVDVTEDLRRTTEAMAQNNDAQNVVLPEVAPAVAADAISTPTIGGTLNATTAQAADDKRREIELDQNRTILKHGTPLAEQTVGYVETPMNAVMATQADEPPAVDIFSAPPPSMSPAYAQEGAHTPEATAPTPALEPTQPQGDQQSAMAAVDAAFAAQPEPAQTAPIDPTAPTMADIEANPVLGLPPMPDFNSLPPLPPAPTGVDFGALPPLPPAPIEQPAQPQTFNPNQFQIPPQ